jgi:hypothetical protein
MAQKFKETAHLHTDMEKYGEGYDRIFGKKNSSEALANDDGKSSEREEYMRIKELAKSAYFGLGSEQALEGFPESSSFIYGYCKGYQAAREGK